MSIKKKSYSKQFKIDAVKLVIEQGYKISEAARNLDIHPNVLRHWRNQIKTDSDQAFPGKRPYDTGKRGTTSAAKRKYAASNGA